MVAPASKKLFKNYLLIFLGTSLFFASAFTAINDLQQLSEQVKNKLMAVYSRGPENGNVRKFEILITPEGFFRYRKIYTTGKSEYYSFSVGRLKDLRYLGTSASGQMIIQTKSDDIIVQTFNDPKGNVDSMTTDLILPLQQVEAEDLQLISSNLQAIHDQLQAKK
jgi:hypothetical protein